MSDITPKKCPECGGNKIVKVGFSVTRKGKKQRWKCQECGRTFFGSSDVEKE